MITKRTLYGHKLNSRMPFKGMHTVLKYSRPSQAIYPITDLTKYDNKILDQGSEGDCTAASSGGCWMYLQLLKWRLANPNYTPEQFKNVVAAQSAVAMDMIYALELTHDGDFGQDNGSFGATAAVTLSTFGAAYADVWPNTGEGYCRYPSATALHTAAQNKVATYRLLDLKDVRTCLSEGYPFWMGIPVFNSFVNSPDVMASGIIPMPLSGEREAGGHEIKIVGHSDSQRMLTVANSWGTQVGQNGYFKLPYEYFEKFCNEAYTARLK